MRLWTLHPKYLDAKGLSAVWREALLAQKVLLGQTRGYKNHPQLIRFKARRAPISAIGAYLSGIYKEAAKRGYAFDRRKIISAGTVKSITAKRGQLAFEWNHLLAKVKKRDRKKYRGLLAVKRPVPHPIFKIIDGGIEDWERNILKKNTRLMSGTGSSKRRIGIRRPR
jgi:hypothetical protein